MPALPSVSAGSATTWTMPSWSRRSMKTIWPMLRATSAQPHRVTVWPINASSIRPQKWVRMGAPERGSGRHGAGEPRILAGSARGLGLGRLGGGRRGLRVRRGGGVRLRFRLRLRGGLGALAALAGQVALAVAVLLEVGLVPAAAGQPELRRGQLAAHRALRAAGGAGGRIGVGQLLQAVEVVAAGI